MTRNDHTLPVTLSVSPRSRKDAGAVTGIIRRLQARMVTRRALGRLDQHLLRDIGLDVVSARTESEKPFWQD